MRNSTQLVRAFVAAALLSGVMVVGTSVQASGMSGDPATTLVCEFAQGIIYKVPAKAREVLKGVFEGITGCTELQTEPAPPAA